MTIETDPSVYERLRLHYDKRGSKAVRKIVGNILKLRFTPEEAEFALMIPVARGVTPPDARGVTTLSRLVETSGMEKSQVHSLVETLTEKGLVQWRRNRENTGWKEDPEKEDPFRLFDFEYSLYTPMVGDGVTNDSKRKVVEQREKLVQMGFSLMGTQLENSGFPYIRFLPVEDFVDASETLEPWEKFSHFVEQAWLITAVACGCRATTNACNRSVFSCFHFDDSAYHWINYRGTRRLSKEEAIELQRKVQREDGLVCQGMNTKEMPMAICSCCGDDCIWFRPYNEQNHPGPFVKTNFLPHWNMDNCINCFVCKDTCPVEAIVRHISRSDEEEDIPQVMEHRCVGCGVCAAACPREAILLKRVRNEIPVDTMRELLVERTAQAGIGG